MDYSFLLQLIQSFYNLNSVANNFLLCQHCLSVFKDRVEVAFVAVFSDNADVPLSDSFRFVQERIEEFFIVLSFGVLVDQLFELGHSMALAQHLKS